MSNSSTNERSLSLETPREDAAVSIEVQLRNIFTVFAKIFDANESTFSYAIKSQTNLNKLWC